MIPIRFTARPNPNRLRLPPYEIDGFVPFVGCPLAVSRDFEWDGDAWQECEGWVISHVPTGYRLGEDKSWRTAEKAMAVLMRCNPSFPAWAFAKGGPATDSATRACWPLWRAAIAER